MAERHESRNPPNTTRAFAKLPSDAAMPSRTAIVERKNVDLSGLTADELVRTTCELMKELGMSKANSTETNGGAVHIFDVAAPEKMRVIPREILESYANFLQAEKCAIADAMGADRSARIDKIIRQMNSMGIESVSIMAQGEGGGTKNGFNVRVQDRTTLEKLPPEVLLQFSQDIARKHSEFLLG